MNALTQQKEEVAQKEKELQSLYSKLKTVKAQVEVGKQKKVYTEAQVVGFEKLNQLESKLKELEKKNAELQAEANSLQRIKNE